MQDKLKMVNELVNAVVASVKRGDAKSEAAEYQATKRLLRELLGRVVTKEDVNRARSEIWQ